jgi:predicted nucleic acid-binding protein
MAEYLADKSGLTRHATRPEVREVIEPLLLAGRLATCSIVDLELLYSARDPKTYQQLAIALQGMPRVAITEAVMDRALDVQARLARKSQHRAVPLPDLIIAACAETNGLVVLHYDSDYELIATVTKQPIQWVVPRGSVS